MVVALILVMNNHLTIGGLLMNRPIFSCPHCGGVLVFDDECTECQKCKRIVNFDELARHIFTKKYGFNMDKPVSKDDHDIHDIHICHKELSHLIGNHPCLLDQAYGYGYQAIAGDHYFYNQPKILVDNMKLAINKIYYI